MILFYFIWVQSQNLYYSMREKVDVVGRKKCKVFLEGNVLNNDYV